MFQESLKDFRSSPNQIRENTKERVLYMCEQGLVFRNGIDFIRRQIHEGDSVVLSTTNFVEGAQGVMDALESYSLVLKEEKECIQVAGTEVDWKKKEIEHFNVDIGKLLHPSIIGAMLSNEMRSAWNDQLRIGLEMNRESFLRMEADIHEFSYIIHEQIQSKNIPIGYTAGDQPDGNDKALAQLGGNNFLYIDSNKNDPWKSILDEFKKVA